MESMSGGEDVIYLIRCAGTDKREHGGELLDCIVTLPREPSLNVWEIPEWFARRQTCSGLYTRCDLR